MEPGRVPFRVEETRRWVLGSLAGHVGITVLFSLLGAALLSPPPPLQVVRVNLQTMEFPSDEPPAMPVVQSEPEPEVVEEAPVEDSVPTPPQEVIATPPEPVPDEESGVKEEPAPAVEPAAPDFELPREAEPVQAEEEDLDLPEPAAVQAAREEPEPAPRSAAEPEEVAVGATVQATASEGIDDTYLRLVQQKIGRGWRPTDASTRGLREVACVVSFRIGPGGQVIAPTVTTSSGLSVFDRRALASVERAAPLPAPPARFGGSGVEIDFRFSYSR
jgi:protein TonB